jgi:superfamily II DNA or RNA helicase
MELRPYQIAAIQAIYEEWKERQRTLLVLPTGCGKTIVFADIAKKRTVKGRVLILAHREELLEQARDKIMFSCGMNCSIEKAEKSCIDSPELITVGSVQTLMSEKRLNRFAPDYFKTVIIDEAHHALAKSYQNVLQYFSAAKVLGVTATPDRGDMRKLGEYFESLAYEYSLRNAVKDRYLSPIRVQTMPLNIDMSQVGVSCGDFKDNDLGHALDPYLEDIADEMAKVCKDRHTLVFLPLIATSQHFRDILNK